MVYPARSISGTIAAGSEVRVVALDGGTVVVEAIVQDGLGGVIAGIVIGGLLLGGAATATVVLIRRRQATQEPAAS